MTTTVSALQPAIDALEKDLTELERQGNALLTTINVLRAKAGLPPRPGAWAAGPDASTSPEAGRVPLAIRSDSFVGKRMGSAAREYLEMRKAAGIDAPATVREIFDSLKEGGFDFRSKDDGNAIIVLRAMLRKSSSMFHKLQNGKYGLRSWYPNLKAQKNNVAEVEDTDDETQDDAPEPKGVFAKQTDKKTAAA